MVEEGADVADDNSLERTAAGTVVVKREEVGRDGLEGCKEGAGGLGTEDVEMLKSVFSTVAALFLGRV